MKKLIEYGDFTYFKLEDAKEVVDFKIEGFDFFRGLGIINYPRTFQTWLRKFPRPIIIIATKNKTIYSWVHIDQWDEGAAKDGNPIYVLRAIETHPTFRSKRLGFKLVLLGLQQTTGYLITKPINPGAVKFFTRIGFKEEREFSRSPIDLSKHPGHYILPLIKKRELIRDFGVFFEGLHQLEPVKKKEPPEPLPKMRKKISERLLAEIKAKELVGVKVKTLMDRPGRLAVVYDPTHVIHRPQTPNPENPERLNRIINYLSNRVNFFDRYATLITNVDPAPLEAVLRVHTSEYIEFIRSLCRRGGGFIGDSTYLTPASFEVALQAIGGVLKSGDLVVSGQYDFSFAVIRPPGHHASKDRYGGYCIFNNAAILARYLQHVKRRKRIMIIDWDAHAANGTMEIFYSDPTVFLISLHQDPHGQYPRTGFSNQLGKGQGLGHTVNIEMPEGAGNIEYKMAFKELVEPLIAAYKPDFFIACNGFDIHHSERNTDLQVTSEGIYMIFKTIRELTIGKVAIVMEGGYNQTIGELTHSACAGLLGLNNPYIEKNDVLSTSALKRIKTHRIMEERLAELKMILREYHDI